MLNNILIKILLLSLSGSVIAFILFAILRFVKFKLTKIWQYYIWLAVILRMLVPYSPENSLMRGLYNLLENNSQILRNAKNIEITGVFGAISNYIGGSVVKYCDTSIVKKDNQLSSLRPFHKNKPENDSRYKRYANLL